MYCKNIFKDKFINCNFDNELIEMDNALVNSNEEYLDIKNNYLKKSNENLSNITLLIEDYNLLSYNYCITCNENITSHKYTFINTKNLENINNNIKKILKEQQYIYDNFRHYITFINSTKLISPIKYQKEINQPQTIKITDRN